MGSYICAELDMSALENILIGSESLFMKYGIKSITMDEIARELGISKKTLYQHVDNKADLVAMVIKRHFEGEKKFMEGIGRESENSVDEMIRIFRHVAQHLRRVSPTVVFDLQRYYPEAWKVQTDFKNKYIHNCITQNIERGIKEGFYRKDVNIDIISKFYINTIEVLTDSDIFPVGEYTFVEIYSQFIQYHLNGLLTEKGRAIFEESFKPE